MAAPRPESTDERHAGAYALAALLRRSPELLGEQLDAAALYCFDGTLVMANRAAAHMLNVAPGAHTGSHFAEDVLPSELPRVRAAFAAVVETGETREMVTTLRRPDGTLTDVLVRIAPARLDGTMVGVYGFAREVTPNDRLERRFARRFQEFRSLFEHHPESITMLDRAGLYQRWNAAAERLTGYFDHEMRGKSPCTLLRDDSRDIFDGYAHALERGTAFTYETSIVRKDGVCVDIESKFIPIVVDGEVTGAFSISKDVTARKRGEAALARQTTRVTELYRIASRTGSSWEERVQRALEAGVRELGAHDGHVVRLAAGGAFEVMHSSGERYARGHVGSLDDSLLRHVFAQEGIFVAEDLAAPQWSDEDSPASRVYRSYVGIPLRVDGTLYGVLGFGNVAEPTVLSDTDRDYVGALAALAASALERGAQQRALETLAHYDQLTALPNRVLLTDRIEQLLARRSRQPFALHFIDIDRFKAVNDRHGHAAGDELLRTVARRLRATLRERDTLARLGGDELVVVQPDIGSAADALRLAERLRAAAAAEPVVLANGEPIAVTLSVGVSISPYDGTTVASLLGAADEALYRVKQGGRNAVRLYSDANH